MAIVFTFYDSSDDALADEGEVADDNEAAGFIYINQKMVTRSGGWVKAPRHGNIQVDIRHKLHKLESDERIMDWHLHQKPTNNV